MWPGSLIPPFEVYTVKSRLKGYRIALLLPILFLELNLESPVDFSLYRNTDPFLECMWFCPPSHHFPQNEHCRSGEPGACGAKMSCLAEAQGPGEGGL